MKIRLGFVAAVCGFIVAAPAAAHHSRAMFDSDKEVALAGTIKEFHWGSPHGWVKVNVTDSRGRVQEWSLEVEGPGMLARRGWTKSSLKPGDKVSLKLKPMKDGTPGGLLVTVTLENGKVLEA